MVQEPSSFASSARIPHLQVQALSEGRSYLFFDLRKSAL